MFYNNFNMNGCCNNENKCCPTVCEEKCCEDPVYEAPVEKCIKKDFVHEIVQDYPFMSYELMINKYKLKSYYEIIFTFIITLFILIFHP